jgi:integrase
MPLKVVKRKGSPHLYLRGTVRGASVYESAGTSSRVTAEAIRIKREARLLDRSIFGPSASVTFAEAAESYLNAGGEGRFLAPLNERLGMTLLSDIDQDTADKLSDEIYQRTSPATRKRQLYIPLCAVLNHAARKKWCAKPAIEHPSVPETRPTWSSPERLAKLLPHCSPQMRRFLLIGAYTGARLSEILRLEWERDVNLAMRTITFQRTKNGDMRTVHIPLPLFMELAEVPERHGPVFAWTHKQSVYVPLRNACKRAGVEYLPPHQQGRHTYATWMRTYGGLDLVGLKQAGGWKNIQSVVKYAHVAPTEAGLASDKLPSVQKACSQNYESAKSLTRRDKP